MSQNARRGHASVAAIQVLRGVNVGDYGRQRFNPNSIQACDGWKINSYPFLGELTAKIWMEGGEEALPTCQHCAALVVGALAIRTAVNLEDVADLMK